MPPLYPPLPKPDLKAAKFILPRANGTMSMAGIICNDGDGPAHDPFKVVLGATHLDVSRVLIRQIPRSVTIEGHGSDYQTPEAIEDIPVLSVDDNPNHVYRFDMLVDADSGSRETIEPNNSLSIDRFHL